MFTKNPVVAVVPTVFVVEGACEINTQSPFVWSQIKLYDNLADAIDHANRFAGRQSDGLNFLSRVTRYTP